MRPRYLLAAALLAAATSGCERSASASGRHAPRVGVTEPDAPPATPASLPAPDDCEPPAGLRVLFVGNSYTIKHDLAHLVEDLGRQAGIAIEADLLARGGEDFEFHAERERTEQVLERGDYDVVVLQSHSLHTLRDPEGFADSGRKLAELARSHGARPVLFETWAREAGHNVYGYLGDLAGHSPAEMHARVHAQYAALGAELRAPVVDVGGAWLAVAQREPELELYLADGHHPGRLGSYLTANLMFAALTEVDPVGSVGPLMGIRESVARTLQRYAADIVAPRCGAL